MSLLGLMDIPLTIYNNLEGRSRTNYDRERNFELNELAANNADKRTRALYEDYYSPAALLRQYNEAGLSPSLMFGGTPGQGGTSGAQGAGTPGPQSPFMPVSLLEAAQAAQLFAQVDKTKAETRNIREDTILKQTQEIWNTFVNAEKKIEVEIATMNFINKKTNEYASLYDLANECDSWETFKKAYKEIEDKDFQAQAATAKGEEVLQKIYYNANKLERDIETLNTETLDAQFQYEVIKQLKDNKFAEQNASTILAQLQAAAESANLTKEQKGAWNNIINSLRKKNSTAADILIIMAMIFNNAASNWVHTNVGIKTDGTSK